MIYPRFETFDMVPNYNRWSAAVGESRDGHNKPNSFGLLFVFFELAGILVVSRPFDATAVFHVGQAIRSVFFFFFLLALGARISCVLGLGGG